MSITIKLLRATSFLDSCINWHELNLGGKKDYQAAMEMVDEVKALTPSSLDHPGHSSLKKLLEASRLLLSCVNCHELGEENVEDYKQALDIITEAKAYASKYPVASNCMGFSILPGLPGDCYAVYVDGCRVDEYSRQENAEAHVETARRLGRVAYWNKEGAYDIEAERKLFEEDLRKHSVDFDASDWDNSIGMYSSSGLQQRFFGWVSGRAALKSQFRPATGRVYLVLKHVLFLLKCYRGEIALDGKRPNDLRETDEAITSVDAAIMEENLFKDIEQRAIQKQESRGM